MEYKTKLEDCEKEEPNRQPFMVEELMNMAACQTTTRK